MTVIFHQEAGSRAQTWRFADDRLVLARADNSGAAEIALAYCDIALDAAQTVAPRGPPWRRRPGATRYPIVAGRRQGEAIEVWRDLHHDAIVAELALRWKAARKALVRVDFGADPGREMQRFEALMRRGLVSAEECAAAIARIVASAA